MSDEPLRNEMKTILPIPHGRAMQVTWEEVSGGVERKIFIGYVDDRDVFHSLHANMTLRVVTTPKGQARSLVVNHFPDKEGIHSVKRTVQVGVGGEVVKRNGCPIPDRRTVDASAKTKPLKNLLKPRPLALS